ncbi:DUF4332 domain-containing protein [Ulvibacterium sp.]|uniref:DUF4332 domain-containing protein n=1 Tax=Ulvibacterium sp. TaxID=2665914 RepID=UPI003BAB3795
MGYYIDLEKISIDQYKKVLKSADLLPSWMVLKENIEENLDILKKQGIQNLDELQKALKTKGKLQEFSGKSGLDENYLMVLRRVVNGYRPKPNRIRDFPNISKDIAVELELLGIKNTLKLYPEILSKEKRNRLSDRTGIHQKEIRKLAKLTDLSRIRWVNHTFAYVLLEAGYDTAKKVAEANNQEMYETVKQLNIERKIYNAHIGAHDMKLCVEAAKGLDFEIEY